MDGYGPPPAAPSAPEPDAPPSANDYRPQRLRDQQVIAGRRLPDILPVPAPGSMEAIADELAQWVATTGDAVAARIMSSDTAPFAAKATEQQQAEFYARTLFADDGTPDPQAWSSTFQRTGAYGLVEAVRGAETWRKANGLPTQLPPAQGQAGAEHALSDAQQRADLARIEPGLALAQHGITLGQTGGAGPAGPPASGPASPVAPPPTPPVAMPGMPPVGGP